MIFDIQYKEPVVYDGYSIAAKVLLLPEMIYRIKETVKFTYTDAYPSKVARDFSIFTRNTTGIPVKDYFYKNPRVIGMTKGTGVIFVNRNGVNKRSVVDYFRNGLHEAGHLCGYGHGSNWTQDTWKGRMMCRILGDKEDKNLSVPYLIEVIALDLAKKKGWI